MLTISRFRVLLCGLLLVVSGALSGCIIDASDDDDPIIAADLEVQWSVNGSTAPALCDVYGIWDFEVRIVSGPEIPATVVVDCLADPWDTGRALYRIAEGNYVVEVIAFDEAGFEIGARTEALNLTDFGDIEVLEIIFDPADLS